LGIRKESQSFSETGVEGVNQDSKKTEQAIDGVCTANGQRNVGDCEMGPELESQGFQGKTVVWKPGKVPLGSHGNGGKRPRGGLGSMIGWPDVGYRECFKLRMLLTSRPSVAKAGSS